MATTRDHTDPRDTRSLGLRPVFMVQRLTPAKGAGWVGRALAEPVVNDREVTGFVRVRFGCRAMPEQDRTTQEVALSSIRKHRSILRLADRRKESRVQRIARLASRALPALDTVLSVPSPAAASISGDGRPSVQPGPTSG